MRDFTVPKGQLQLLGNGGMGLVLEKCLLDHHQLIGREAAQKFLHPGIRLSGEDGFIGIGLLGCKYRQPVLGFDGRPAGPPGEVDALVAGDGVDPGGRRGPPAIEARGLAPHHYQGFLGHFLRGFCIGAAAHDEGLHARRVVAEQAGEGRAVLAGRDGLDQVGGLVGRKHRPTV